MFLRLEAFHPSGPGTTGPAGPSALTDVFSKRIYGGFVGFFNFPTQFFYLVSAA